MIQSNFYNITHNDLIRIEKEWKEDDSKCNVSKNLQDAILCYYLNSGYARFNEHLSFSQDYNEKRIDIKVITDEIENEMLTDKELYNRIESYFKAHNFSTSLLSCGACGIREFESENDTASIQYTKVTLESLPEVYKMNSIDKKKLHDWIAEGPITIPKVDSNNDNDNSEEEEILVEPWRIMSFYKSDDSNFYYYLHPELVNKNNTEKESTYLCPRCYKAYKNDTCYKFSIAAGIDFGNFHRINGLIKPNLHEQIILSLN